VAADYHSFVEKINNKLSIDLTLYKEAQMKRRLTSLRNKRGYQNFKTYYTEMNNNKELLDEFVDRITINVSEFYRNPKRWDVLRHQTIPHLIENKKHLRIWSAACSTGEEPYSLAILLNEHFPHITYEIIATDLDLGVLDAAKQGVYQEKSLNDLPTNFKKKYFKQENNLYYIDPSLRKSITFKQHNLLADTYPKNIDLIVCRNVLIYFTDEAKNYIYNHFHSSLVDNGILFVGSTEQIFNPESYGFSTFETFFYKK